MTSLTVRDLRQALPACWPALAFRWRSLVLFFWPLPSYLGRWVILVVYGTSTSRKPSEKTVTIPHRQLQKPHADSETVRYLSAGMGCGASLPQSLPRTSDGTGAFVHLRNLDKCISLAGALAPKKQFKVVARNGVAYLAPITNPTASLWGSRDGTRARTSRDTTKVAHRDSCPHRRLSSTTIVDGLVSPFDKPHIGSVRPDTDPTFRSVATKASRDHSERGNPSVLELSRTTRVSTMSTAPS